MWRRDCKPEQGDRRLRRAGKALPPIAGTAFYSDAVGAVASFSDTLFVDSPAVGSWRRAAQALPPEQALATVHDPRFNWATVQF